ncbi:LytTR family transcriptional regulator DNA-binding domain-containing protein [Cohnella thailandensis]|uniref:LytTR family transcriptional regulator DNA-binding domain-containing protein n=1 Tax=Cohnella thailandensis TaxID=557557 RepID=A0A841SXI4_9BACL|nr:LytTR family transcriptional regulator DNA-binding domain-containing protein [Cohnella thailandensis]MBB6635629.1 LytTR family transcriptional regulator DNA-binding domain-containing protein [Cohnella thailandensis]MBP1975009.1 DNA-binding LytR/AlgR family response regulator [Cohnella thailandensis]
MDVASNLYDTFEPQKDSLYFKVGTHGLISFHGRNYNIKKRMSPEQRNGLLRDDTFFRLTSDCYVNVDKISDIAEDCLIFGDRSAGSKKLPVSKRKQQIIKQLLSERAGKPH